ncbi:MAG: HAMP domain-containing sensor histidine kinase [Chloroherpetonaceae bacterium]
MSLRTRITLLFIALTSVLLMTFSGVIYYAATKTREREFFEVLRKEAITKANLFFVAKIPAETLQDIYKNNRQTLREVEVAIYDSAFKLLYHDAYDIDFVKESPEMIATIYERGEITFYQEGWQVIGMLYEHNGSHYTLTAAAFDEYGYAKLESLSRTVILALGSYVLIVFAIGRFFTERAIRPIRDINDNAKRITARQLNLRINPRNSGDELAELVGAFNGMLDRLEKSFTLQKEFVSNVSHELRTPLSAMILDLELLRSRKDTSDEVRLTAEKLLNDTKRLKTILQSLIDLARAGHDASEIKFEEIRLDDAVVEARQALLSANPEWKIDISFDNVTDDDDALTIFANRYLIELALVNVLSNACKFSPSKHASVSLRAEGDDAVVEIKDNGVGIDEEELEKIFTPFYRGKNKHHSHGTGIGLALTKRIIDLHNGRLSMTSQVNLGTTVTLAFKNQARQKGA